MTNLPLEASAASGQAPIEGWKRYARFSTDHKVIGVQYLLTAFFFFLVAGLLAMIVRAELLTPNLDLVDRALYNGLFTMHGSCLLYTSDAADE